MKKQHIQKLLDSNEAWAKRFAQDNPGIFEQLSTQQAPQYLWIGCSDSRIPANEVMGLLPGEVFVHRNIGNLVHSMDINCQSVIQFAVEQLKVKDIIVGGHYDCGAIKAALSMEDFGMMNNWLSAIKDTYVESSREFHLMDKQQEIDRLCELNVMKQVLNVCKSNTVQRAWSQGQTLFIHGLIYGVHNGRLVDLDVSIDNNNTLNQIYCLNVAN
ncbi:carbonic anhydrase [Suttonella sp. R2A3]|uniref:carbonic anhydrase n=1 Tax=Suttonella sp. R2A3 TaxID=2908648 RepID=UPI001F3ED5A8|nr:carbonic anhydrase [Suttonella sp. R2A3]UJF24756.1 carbonic anhydrase [Suttonella sp. R2A3]